MSFKKVSGFVVKNYNKYSFLVICPYNKECVAALKAVGGDGYYQGSWHFVRKLKEQVLEIIDRYHGTTFHEQYLNMRARTNNQ